MCRLPCGQHKCVQLDAWGPADLFVLTSDVFSLYLPYTYSRQNQESVSRPTQANIFVTVSFGWQRGPQ